MRRLVYGVILVTLITVPTGGAGAKGFWRSGYSAMSETDSFQKASDTKVWKHEVGPQWKGTELKLHIVATEGDVALKLLDPTGSTRWEKTIKGTFSFDENFPGPAGVWKVELRLKEATGRYEVKLVAI